MKMMFRMLKFKGVSNVFILFGKNSKNENLTIDQVYDLIAARIITTK